MRKQIKIIVYVVLLLAFILLSVDFYLSKKFYSPSSNMILENPKEYDGRQFAFIGPVMNTSSSSFYMNVNHRPLKVHYDNLQKPVLGQIYIIGIVNEDGSVTATQVHNLSYNYLKYAISFFALLLFIYLFFKDWKIKHWRFVENA